MNLSDVMSPAQVAAQFGVGSSTVRSWLNDHKTEVNPETEARKLDGRTWVLTRDFATRRWGRTEQPEQGGYTHVGKKTDN